MAYLGSAAQSCPTLRPHGLQPARPLCLWDSPGQDTGVGFHALLQGLLSTQGSNPGLLHCRQTLHCLRHQGNPSAEHKPRVTGVPLTPLPTKPGYPVLQANSLPSESSGKPTKEVLNECFNIAITLHFL